MSSRIRIPFTHFIEEYQNEVRDPVSAFLDPKIGLPVLLFLADSDFDYFLHLGTTLWQYQFGLAKTRRLMNSVVMCVFFIQIYTLEGR